MRCVLAFCVALALSGLVVAGDGNRLSYLDSNEVWYPHKDFPKLITPQWVGEEGVECVVTLAIDDMRDPAKYEAYLRPILQRLKQIDGRAPVSIMTNSVKPDDPQLQAWLQEGLSIECHTFDHPCPILAGGDIKKAKATYDRCVDLIGTIPNNKPVAFRTPCCDSLNTLSPRLFSEIINKTTPAGNFLQLDSSVFTLYTADDPSIPRELLYDPDGKEKFRKYLPRGLKRGDLTHDGFVNYIENYPYPYVIQRTCWEFPCVVPSDWSAQHLHQPNNPDTVRDWKAALDITVLKQGVFNLVFHPHNWIKPEQVVELIDHAVTKHGKKVKFLTFKECVERLNKNVSEGFQLRQRPRLEIRDLNGDGFMDIARTMHADVDMEWPIDASTWDNSERQWNKELPTWGITPLREGPRHAVLDIDSDGKPEVFWDEVSEETTENPEGHLNERLPSGVNIWSGKRPIWDSAARFVDINQDGNLDLVYSDNSRCGVWLFESIKKGWSIELLNAKRGEGKSYVELPPIVREDGSDNGFFVKDRHLCWINEDTDGLPDFLMRVAFDKLLGDRLPDAKLPEAAKQSMRVAPGYRADLVAHEPLTMDPVALDFGPDGKLWVAEMADYPRGIPDDEPDPNLARNGSDVRRGSPDPAEGTTEGLQNGKKMSDKKTEEGDLRSTSGRGQETRAQRRAGRIRYLEDTDGDGVYDKSTLFMDDVPFPNGVISWKKGVLVSAAPDIFYAEDTDGDGKADVKHVLFTGFAEGNQQHRANGFVRGLDNWLYLANGDSGGSVACVQSLNDAVKKGSAPQPSTIDPKPRTDIRGRDIRIRPDTGEIEAISGQTQFGRNRDDWGNWFGNNNSRPMWHFVLDEHYLRRNPYLDAPNGQKDVSVVPGAAPVFPASKTLTRFNDFHTANRFTSACSSMVYRDELLFPSPPSAAERGDGTRETFVFISEPVHNLVHREVMTPDGLSFTSQRHVNEQQSEFLASTDNWFRPTQLKTGPDGALYVADMYRLVIEHPEWIPIAWQRKLDLRAGHDKGRIWRVAPAAAKLRVMPRLDKMTTPQLVAALDSPNGWQRDLAQQLLIDRADSAAVPLLREIVSGTTEARRTDVGRETEPRSGDRIKPGASAPGTTSETSQAPEGRPQRNDRDVGRPSGAAVVGEPKPGADAPGYTRTSLRDSDSQTNRHALARLHALYTLEGLTGGLTVPVVVAGLKDEHPGVRRHAIRLCGVAGLPKEGLVEHLVSLVDDADPQVRMQLAYTLGEIRSTRADAALGKLAAKASGQPWMMAAVLSSLRTDNLTAVMTEAIAAAPDDTALLNQLLAQATAFKNDEAAIGLLTRVTEPSSDGSYARWQLLAMEQFSLALDRRDDKFNPFAKIPEGLQLIKRVEAMAEAVQKLATNSDANLSDREVAVRLLRLDSDAAVLQSLLVPQQPPSLQSAAIMALGRMKRPEVAKELLAAYRSLAPALRAEAASVLLSRDAWRDELLAALESKQLQPTDLDATSRQRLLDHKTKEVRERAARLLAVDLNTDRAKLVAEYLPTVRTAGDVQHGRQLFTKRCAQCHKLGNEGHAVGPDLASLTDKSHEALLTAILDPNRAVESKFLTFTAVTKSGVSHVGVIANELATSLTLRAAEAKETSLLRSELDELQSTTKSLMPEGLEKEVTPTDAASLIAYIRNNVPLPARKQFPGNEPAVVKPNADGSFTLTPFTAEIYGPTIVIEEKHKNLGWWSSADDHVIWTVQVPKPGRYAVSWTFACEPSAAGETCVIEAAGKSFRHKVAATSSWDDYQTAVIGELELPAGEVRLTAKPASRPLPAMVDVKAIMLSPVK